MTITKQKIIVTVKANTKQLNSEMFRAGKAIRNVKGNLAGMRAVANLNQEQFKRMGTSLRTSTNAGVRFAGKMRLMTAGLRGFRMEMLGVMFFGMAMSRMFGGMLKPASKAMGIFSLWGDILLVTFLPIMKKLLKPFLKFANAMFKMDEKGRLAIGTFVLLGLLFGTILFLVGVLALGIGSLFGTMFFAKILLGATLMAGFIVIVAGLAAIFTGVAMIINKELKGIGIVIIGIGLIITFFAFWWGLLAIAVGIAVFLLIKHWDKFKNFFIDLNFKLKIKFAETIISWRRGLEGFFRDLSKRRGFGWLERVADKMSEVSKLDELFVMRLKDARAGFKQASEQAELRAKLAKIEAETRGEKPDETLLSEGIASIKGFIAPTTPTVQDTTELDTNLKDIQTKVDELQKVGGVVINQENNITGFNKEETEDLMKDVAQIAIDAAALEVKRDGGTGG